MNPTPDEKNTGPSDTNCRGVAAPQRSILALDERINSRDLFVGGREIIIVHGTETYRLRLTAQNKLILTK